MELKAAPVVLPLPERLQIEVRGMRESTMARAWYVYINGQLLPLEGVNYVLTSENLTLHTSLWSYDVITVTAPLLDERWYYCKDRGGWVRL